ncbi:glycosyltransferase [Weissella muntiaci]|uniref:Glycosyltransferase n=2 Tax=Weissella muntiaci TaxID=2508881 RepID=A0A6C2C2F5_9LACO|nr:glycosyltransferase [Weissella muntiaci]
MGKMRGEMRVINFNIGLGWASSGVEYAQAYREKIFRNLPVEDYYVFLGMTKENMASMAKNIGIPSEKIIWVYNFFSDIALQEAKMNLAQVLLEYGVATEFVMEPRNKDIQVVNNKDRNEYLRVYFKKDLDLVERVELVSHGNLIRKDFYTSTRWMSEFYEPVDKKAKLTLREVYNEDRGIALAEIVNVADENLNTYLLDDRIYFNKAELIAEFVRRLQPTASDVLILDRATDIAEPILLNKEAAKTGFVVHAEHYSKNNTDDEHILWNNYYDYQFTNIDIFDFVITATELQKVKLSEQLEKYNNKIPKIYAIPVGALEQIKPVQERAENHFVTASRLASEKHIDLLVKAVGQVLKDGYDVSFDIYGEGSQRKMLEDLIRSLNVSENVKLLGHQNMASLYSKYGLYLTASKSEGFGLTLMEAVGDGLPIIGLDVPYGNQTFVVEAENGYLIPLSDDDEQVVKQLAGRIEEFLGMNDKTSFHQNSYRLAEAFTVEQLQKKWLDLFEELTNADTI